MPSWVRESTLTGSLERAGFTADSARSRAAMVKKCSRALESASRAWWVPGRIEVLGKHTDYAGGRSLLCATDVGAVFLVAPRSDAQVRILDVRSDLETTFEIGPELGTTTGDWTNYPRTVARRLSRNFGPLLGADIAFSSDLPLAAGMSSSSALIVAFSLILIGTNDLARRDDYSENIHTLEDLAGYLATVENGRTFGTLTGDAGVGTFGGSEDHTAILCSTPGMLKQYSFCPVRHEHSVRLPDSHCFVIASSGVVAEKTGVALERYNRVSRLAGATTHALSDGLGMPVEHMAAAIGAGDIESLRVSLDKAKNEFSSEDLLDRFNQFVIESEEVIPSAISALDQGDLATFGSEVKRSQDTGAKLLKNQVEQTVWLADRAVALGAVGASAFGAGFGGSVWALLEGERIPEFLRQWQSDYVGRFPDCESSAEFLVARPGPAAFEITDARLD